jgi:hypothetical protein
MVSGPPALAKPVVCAPLQDAPEKKATTASGQPGRGARGRPVFVNGLPSKGARGGAERRQRVWSFSLRGRRALLSAIPAGEAALVSATTVALPRATACLGMPRLLVATLATARFTTSAEVRATVGAIASTSRYRRPHLLCVGALRGEKSQRGGHEGSAAELYRLTARDCAALQAHRQFVEGANTSFIFVRQQRNSPFPGTLFILTLTTFASKIYPEMNRAS